MNNKRNLTIIVLVLVVILFVSFSLKNKNIKKDLSANLKNESKKELRISSSCDKDIYSFIKGFYGKIDNLTATNGSNGYKVVVTDKKDIDEFVYALSCVRVKTKSSDRFMGFRYGVNLCDEEDIIKSITINENSISFDGGYYQLSSCKKLNKWFENHLVKVEKAQKGLTQYDQEFIECLKSFEDKTDKVVFNYSNGKIVELNDRKHIKSLIRRIKKLELIEKKSEDYLTSNCEICFFQSDEVLKKIIIRGDSISIDKVIYINSSIISLDELIKKNVEVKK